MIKITMRKLWTSGPNVKLTVQKVMKIVMMLAMINTIGLNTRIVMINVMEMIGKIVKTLVIWNTMRRHAMENVVHTGMNGSTNLKMNVLRSVFMMMIGEPDETDDSSLEFDAVI